MNNALNLSLDDLKNEILYRDILLEERDVLLEERAKLIETRDVEIKRLIEQLE